ncbi:unnamed protein product [Protopolystoma xenopodis]|uniref:Uncharacterized protein n=1 Tax=Protopolystoma xenopodis TaxID=117903 RepID=A0A3S5ACS2_9PLAT|nr:unnamed protein product [Protopolystoma xenopodis]
MNIKYLTFFLFIKEHKGKQAAQDGKGIGLFASTLLIDQSSSPSVPVQKSSSSGSCSGECSEVGGRIQRKVPRKVCTKCETPHESTAECCGALDKELEEQRIYKIGFEDHTKNVTSFCSGNLVGFESSSGIGGHETGASDSSGVEKRLGARSSLATSRVHLLPRTGCCQEAVVATIRHSGAAIPDESMQHGVAATSHFVTGHETSDVCKENRAPHWPSKQMHRSATDTNIAYEFNSQVKYLIN